MRRTIDHAARAHTFRLRRRTVAPAMTARETRSWTRSVPAGLSDAQFISIAWAKGVKTPQKRAVALAEYRKR